MISDVEHLFMCLLADTNVENGLEDMGKGKGKLGRSDIVASTYIHYQM